MKYIKGGYVTSISSHTRTDSPTGVNELYAKQGIIELRQQTDLKRKYCDLTIDKVELNKVAIKFELRD